MDSDDERLKEIYYVVYVYVCVHVHACMCAYCDGVNDVWPFSLQNSYMIDLFSSFAY